MIPSEYRNLLERYDLVVSELSKIGIVVKEIYGYSDRHYGFVGATTVECDTDGAASGYPWLFTEDKMHKFTKRAETFLAGYNYGVVDSL